MTIILGQVATPLRIFITRGSPAVFSLRFWADSAQTQAADLAGNTVTLVISPQAAPAVTWTAEVSGQTASWELTSADTAVSWKSPNVRLLIDDYVLAEGTMVIQ